MVARLVQINDQLLLNVTQRNGRGMPPIIFTSVCAASEGYRTLLRPRFKDTRFRIGRGGLNNLFDYYRDLRPPPPPPGTVVIRAREPATFDNLQTFASDRKTFRAALEDAFEAYVASLCPPPAKTLVVDIDGNHEGRITIQRLYCVVDLDIYVAVNLRALMDPDDFEDLIDSVQEEFRQTGKTYTSQQVSVRRGGRQVSDYPILRRKGANVLIAYLRVGQLTCTIQTGWDEQDGRNPCARDQGDSRAIWDEFRLRYDLDLDFDGLEIEPRQPELDESDTRDELRPIRIEFPRRF